MSAFKKYTMITLGVVAIGVTLFVWQNRRDSDKFSNGEVLPIKETDAALGILHSPTYSIPKDVSPKPLDEAMIRRLFSHFADQELPGTLGEASGYAYANSWGVGFEFEFLVNPETVPTFADAVKEKWKEPLPGTLDPNDAYTFSAIRYQEARPGVLVLPKEAWSVRATGGQAAFLPIPNFFGEFLGVQTTNIRDFYVKWRLCPVTGYVSLSVGRFSD